MEKKSSTKRMLTLKEKIEILYWYHLNKASVRNLASKFEIGKTQAANIVRKKDELIKKWHECGNVNEKRSFYKSNGLKIDQHTYDWYVKARSKNMTVSGPILRRKAKEIAEGLGIESFKASEGWLEKFRIRHNIAFKSIPAESTTVNREVNVVNKDEVAKITEQVPEIIEYVQFLTTLLARRTNKAATT